MNFLKHIFSYDFLLYINRVRLERVDKVFLGLACLALLVAIAIRVWARFDRHLVRKNLELRIWRLYITFGLLGLLWFGMRYELVSWLGTHAAFLLVVLVAVVWKFYIFKYWFTEYRRERSAWEHKQLKDKYLQMQN